jgi:septal ring factor EnvC (AmiA/AmiB activator)
MVVTSPDLESLYKILGEYAKRSEFEDYTLKSDRDDILKRISRMEKRVEDTTDKMIKWEPEWEKMQANIEYLMQNKIDQATLDEAIDRLKNIISQMSGGNSVVAAFDQDELREAVKRLQAEVDALKKTSFQTTNDLTKLQSAHAETQKVTFANQGNLQNLTQRVERLEDLMNKL